MRIAYIVPYQGAALVEQRPIVRNISLAGRVKVERIAELLQGSGHEVEIISPGEVIELRLKLYPGFVDEKPFNSRIPVFYASALPVRFLNGLWSGLSALRIFRSRHRVSPYDVVVIYNLRPAQILCGRYAIRRLKLPLVLEYEDDLFIGASGKRETNVTGGFFRAAAKKLMHSVSAGTAVSPYLLSQLPLDIPRVLLRGVVGEEIVNAVKQTNGLRKNWVAFSGTHYSVYGLEQLIAAWRMIDLPGWELHIAGCGEMTSTLERLASGNKSIMFEGLLSRQQNAHFLASAKIGINPHDLSEKPGHIFAFKIVEYLAAGLHVLTTPMGALEREIERGVTYLTDNRPETIAASLKELIDNRSYEQTAMEAALARYGPEAVAMSLDNLLRTVARQRGTTGRASEISLGSASGRAESITGR